MSKHTRLKALNKFEKYKFNFGNENLGGMIYPEGASPLLASW
jgi:hypothetical protein